MIDTETTIRLALRLSDDALAAQLTIVEGRASRATDPTWRRALETVADAYRTELANRKDAGR